MAMWCGRTVRLGLSDGGRRGLPRELAERLSARAICETRNLEGVVFDILGKETQ